MIQLIGWTILHSLWQITLIAALYWFGKFSFSKASANTQYLSGVGALLAAISAPIFTFYYLWTSQATTLLTTTLAPITNNLINHPTVPLNNPEEVVALTTTSMVDYLPTLLPYLVAFWGIGVLYFTIRFFQNLNGVQKLKNVDNELISKEWRTKISSFCAQLGIDQPVQVYLSTYVKEPLIFGHFKPVILLPISLITGFDSKAIETIILHELAHIKRHDYLVNLGQSIIEIILFYHPLVWWLSNDIRTVREHCCDDLVLKMGDNRTTYVATLTALQWRKVGVRSNRLSMTAIGNEGDFSKRIKRMFGGQEGRKFSYRQLMSLFLILLIPACGGILYKQYDFEKLFYKNETGVNYPDKKLTYLLDEHTNFEYLNEIRKEVEELGITIDDLSFCTNTEFDSLNNQTQIISVSGLYFRNKGKAIPFYGSDLENEPLKLIFDNGFLKEPILLKKNQEKSSENELSQKEVGNIFYINGSTERKDLLSWVKKLADNNIEFNCDKSVFDGEGKLIEFNVNYKDEYSQRSFRTGMDCSRFYYELVDGMVLGPTFLKEGEDINSLGFTPINLIHDEPIGKIGFTVFKGMSSEELGKQVRNFQRVTGSQITFDNITLYLDDEIIGGIKGKINPNRNGGQIHYFDIHDLEKYSIQFTGRNNQIFSPTYIDNATKQIIKAKKVGSGDKSTLTVNRKTTKSDLANWSKSILKHGVVFNYEKSVFDENDQLIGLNGKFMGKCCYNDEFYINVEDARVQLEIEDNYIYQPTITKGNYNINPSGKFSENNIRPTDNKSKDSWAAVISRTDEQLKDNWIYWGDKKIPFSGKFEADKNGLKKLQVPKLQFTKKEWETLHQEPITFYLDEEWFKIESMFGIVLVPKKKDPVMVNVHKDYYQIVKDESERATRLMASADIGDMLYFEKIDVGKDFTFGMVVEIIENPTDESTGYLPSKDEHLNENIEIDAYNDVKSMFTNGNLIFGNRILMNLKGDSTNFKMPTFKRFPPSNKKDNWIYWGDKKLPFKAFKERGGALEIPRLEFTKKEWEYLRKQPITFYLNEEWFKLQGLNMILVAKRKDPVSINVYKDYYQIIKDDNERVTQLMASADVDDFIYFDKINVGKDFTFGMVIKIIENPTDKSTGYLPSKDEHLNENIEIDFKNAESDFSKGRIPAFENNVSPKKVTSSFLEETKMPRLQSGFIFPKSLKINNKTTFVNGIKHESWMPEILPENIESINMVKGVKARTLYGVEEAVLITTKKGASNFLGKPAPEKEPSNKKN